MTLYAARSGVSIIDVATYNSLISLNSIKHIYTGSSVSGKTGAGVAEFDFASYDHCGSFVLAGVTSIGRIEFNTASDGTGADLTLEIRSGMDPASGVDGTLLKRIVIPGEFIPATAAVFSVPVGLSGLTAGNTYWWRILKAGDATNHFHLVGETSQDGSYPAYYRAAASGNWTLENSIQFTVYSGVAPGGTLSAVMADQAILLIERTAGYPTTLWQYIPDIAGTSGGIRQQITAIYEDGYLIDWEAVDL